MPTGGTTGQVLAKVNSTNYNTTWITPATALLVRDGSSQLLGRVTTVNDTSVTFMTSAGYRLSIGYEGEGQPRQAYFTTTNCTGTPYINTGSTTAASYLWGFVGYYFPGVGWVRPRAVDLDGFGRVQSRNPAGHGITIQSIYNASSGCSASSSSNYTWATEVVSATTLGLPASVSGPLTVQ